MSFGRLLFQTVCVAAIFAAAGALGEDDRPLSKGPSDPERPWEDIPWQLRKGKKPNLISENDLRVEITTDKKVYRVGEPVMVLLKLTNLTDHRLWMARSASSTSGLSNCFNVFVQKCTVGKEGKNTDEDAVGRSRALPEEAREIKVPRTAFGDMEAFGPLSGFRNFSIPAHGESISAFQANTYYDLIPPRFFFQAKEPAVYRIECLYDVRHESNFYIAEFTARATTTFEVISEFATPSQILGGSLEDVFGRSKAIDLLCAEASGILEMLRDQPEMQDENSAEYRRLMMILESLGGLCELEITESLEYLKLHHRVSLEDFNALVSKCRGVRQGLRKE